MSGSNFGGAASEISVSIGSTAATDVLWISDAEIWCRAAPGVGLALALALHVAGRVAAGSVTLSYDPPAILSVSPSLAPVSGPTPLTVLGRGFGPAVSLLSLEALVGGAVVKIVNYTLLSDSAVAISLPGGLVSEAAVAASSVQVIVALDVAGQWRLARVAAVAASPSLGITVARPFLPRRFREQLAEVVWPGEVCPVPTT